MNWLLCNICVCSSVLTSENWSCKFDKSKWNFFSRVEDKIGRSQVLFVAARRRQERRNHLSILLTGWADSWEFSDPWAGERYFWTWPVISHFPLLLQSSSSQTDLPQPCWVSWQAALHSLSLPRLFLSCQFELFFPFHYEFCLFCLLLGNMFGFDCTCELSAEVEMGEREVEKSSIEPLYGHHEKL